MMEILMFPITLIGWIFGFVFKLIGGVFGLVFGLVGGVIGAVFGFLWIGLIIAAVVGLIRWFGGGRRHC